MRRLTFLLALLILTCAPEPPRVILLGLDGADWRLLDRFMDDGTMPELRATVAGGERRVLMTQHPPLSPLVWTSMMTGVSPLEHRILDFTRFHPSTREREPITSDERAVPALWNVAAYNGRRAAVFGMWATFPAEEGVVLTDRDLPRDYQAATVLLRTRALAHVREAKPDLSVIYVQGTDEIGHFTAGDAEKARAYFRTIDAMVGEFRGLAKEQGATLLIVSDHGFDWGGKHEESSTATATAAKWHRDEGVWLRWPSPTRTGATMRVAEVYGAVLDLLKIPRDDYRRRYRRAAPAASPSSMNAEAVKKLQALGYLGAASANAPTGVATRTEGSFNNEGLLLREAGRDDEAERAFRAALAIAPESASARTNLDDLLSARGVRRLGQHDCRGAVADLRAIARESAMKWASIAAAEGCLGNDAQAERAVRRSLELDPNQPQLRAMLR